MQERKFSPSTLVIAASPKALGHVMVECESKREGSDSPWDLLSARAVSEGGGICIDELTTLAGPSLPVHPDLKRKADEGEPPHRITSIYSRAHASAYNVAKC